MLHSLFRRKELKRYGSILKKFLSLLLGFILISLGLTSSLHAELGVHSWSILHMGVSIQTGLTFGQAFQVTGITIILLSTMLGIIPGIGTILNMYLIGVFCDIINASGWMSTPQSMLGRIAMLLMGNLLFAVGTYFYLKPGLGGGPKDSLMLAISQRSKYSISVIRTAMEIIATTIGTIMGGPLGIGTIVLAITIGPLIQGVCHIADLNLKAVKQLNIVEFYRLLKAEES